MVMGMGIGQPMAVISGQGTSDAAFGCSRMKRCRPACEIWMAGFGSLRLDGVAEQRQARQVVYPGDAQLAGRSPAVEVVHPGVLHDHHAHAALRHLFVVAEQAAGDGAVGIGQARVLRGLDDAVLERDVADSAGLEQSGETASAINSSFHQCQLSAVNSMIGSPVSRNGPVALARGTWVHYLSMR